MTTQRPPLHHGRANARRVLAHPLRSRLLAELQVNGDATGAELARALATHTGATSYHLRRLESVGLVVDTGLGDGRSRRWRALQPPVGLDSSAVDSDETGDPDDLAAADWLARDYLEHFTQRAHQWIEHRSTWPAAWRDVTGLEDHLVQVSAEQLTALRAELLELMERYRRVGAGNPHAKRVVLYTCALPLDGPPRPMAR